MTDNTLTTSMVEQTRLVASWVDGADQTLPVPSCPDWRLADLVEHIGATQQWVAALVEDGITDPTSAFAVVSEQSPEPSGWMAWLRQAAERAAAVFAGAASGRDVFDPSGGNDGVTFWRRRLFGEICVHRIDVALTVGQAYELPAPLAGMAIDDWLDTISSAGWAALVTGFAEAMRGHGQTIAWVADDIDRAWVLRRNELPLTLTRAEAADVGDATVVVRGDAVDLLQMVSRRRTLEQVPACRVTGDRGELLHLIDHMDWVAG